jgi:centrosomal CEP192-like protein/beta-propeller repeat-containing protein
MRRKQLLFLFLSCLAAIALLLPFGRFLRPGSRSRLAFPVTQDKQISEAKLLSGYGNLPLTFEENLGQTDARVKFLARGSGYTVFLSEDEIATLRLAASSDDPVGSLRGSARSSTSARPAKYSDAAVQLSLLGANQHARIEGNDLQPGRSNYFIGNDPTRWQRNVPHYARVKYEGVYPGVDLVYYGHQGQLESDYILAPGADPAQIGLQIKGAGAVKLDSQGALVLSTAAGDVVLHKPFAYQETGEGRREVAANFVQHGPYLVGFHVAPYDTRQPLIIDPVVVYSTYLGGSGREAANGIAVDSTGAAYVTGFTTSTNFPTIPGSFQPTAKHTGATQETFVTKLTTDGTTQVYSTYLGGTGSGAGDKGSAIAVNSTGQAFVVGTTGAADFPTTPNAYIKIAPNNSGTAFLAQLSIDGSALLYATYLGGNFNEHGLGVALDPAAASGIAYVVGDTASFNFPLVNPFQLTNKNTASGATAFLAKIDTTKTGTPSLIYSTYLGGANNDSAQAVAVDATGNAYITGQTGSADFPMTSSPHAPFQPTLTSGASNNAFIAKIDTTIAGSGGLIYSSYLGGSGSASAGGDQGNGIALDGNNDAYIGGTTASLNFPTTAGAFQTTNPNAGVFGRTAFVARFDTTKSGTASLIYSTYLGGKGGLGDAGLGIAVDSLKQAYVSGFTTSSDFPITAGAPEPTRQGSNAFMAVLNSTGTSPVVFSTFWGGAGREDGFAIALDTASPPNIYLAGDTSSTPSAPYVPVPTAAFQKTLSGPIDAFVTKFSAASAVGAVTAAPGSLGFGSQTVNTKSPAQTVTLTNGATVALTISSISFSGTNGSDFGETNTCPMSPLTLAAGANCTLSVTFTPTTTAAESATLTIHDVSGSTSTQQTVALTGAGTASGTPDFTVSVSPATSTVNAGASANFTITVTSITGFNSAVTAACTGAPPASTCTLTPTSVTPAANATATINGTIATVARTLAPPPLFFRAPPRFPMWLWGFTSIALAILAAWAATRRTRKLAFGFGILSLLALTGCSGPLHGGTPAGPYTVTVTATSGSLTHPTNFTLNVN